MRTPDHMSQTLVSLTNLRLFEKLPSEQIPTDTPEAQRAWYVEQAKISAILNLILNGCPAARSYVQWFGNELIAQMWGPDAAPGTHKQSEGQSVRIDPLFPGGKFRPYEQWNLRFKELLPGVNIVDSTLETQLRNRFEQMCTDVATFAVNIVYLMQHEGTSGKAFSTFQQLMVLNRESSYVGSPDTITKHFGSISPALAELAAIYVRPDIAPYNDPTDAQRAAGVVVRAHGPYSIRMGTLLHYLHDLGWTEANSKDVNARSFSDDDVEAWTTTAPLALQTVVSNAGACNVQRGDAPYGTADGRFVRTWSVNSTFKNAAWRCLFYGNPALERLPFGPQKALHNSPVYHTKMADIPWYMERLFGLKSKFMKYSSNFRDMLQSLVTAAESGKISYSQGELDAVKNALQSKSDYIGWNAEIIQSGWKFIGGKERMTTFELLSDTHKDLFRSVPRAAEGTRSLSLIGRDQTLRDARALIDILAEDDMLVTYSFTQRLCEFMWYAFSTFIHESADDVEAKADKPESYYAEVPQLTGDPQADAINQAKMDAFFKEQTEKVQLSLRSTGLVSYLDKIIESGLEKTPVATDSDQPAEVLFQLTVDYMGIRHKQAVAKKPELLQHATVKAPELNAAKGIKEAVVTVDLTEF